jgi:PEP-CTERM motif
VLQHPPFFGIGGPQLTPGSGVPEQVPLGLYEFDYSQVGNPGSTTSAVETAEFTTEPSVFAMTQYSNNSAFPCCGAGRWAIAATLAYFVEFSGPTYDVSVDVSGKYTLTTSPAGEAVANLIVNGVYVVSDALYGSNATAGSPFFETISVPTGTLIEVELAVSADAGDASGFQFGSAYLDPYFSIDPSNPNADQYSILVSPGIGNSPISGAPEPSTWAMLLLGFAGLNFAGYRKRKTKNERTAFAA